MENHVNLITNLLTEVSALLVIIIPIIVTMWYKSKKLISEHSKSLSDRDLENLKSKLADYEHELSMLTTHKLKIAVNMLIDKSQYVDLVSFIQLENGTTATTKLQNMYLTCSAESDRYSRIPSSYLSIQRLSVNPFIEYLTYVNSQEDNLDCHIYHKNDDDVIRMMSNEVIGRLIQEECNSWMMLPVRNSDNLISGYVTFKYHEDLSEIPIQEDLEIEKRFIRDCVTSIEFTLRVHFDLLERKKIELGLMTAYGQEGE